MPEKLTLVSYIVQFENGSKDPENYRFRFTDETKAHRYADLQAKNWGPATITRESHTYRVGDAVQIQAFGQTRPGRVVRLLKSRIDVDFQRSNATGERGVRRVGALEVRPTKES